jgi:hypothetical protein
MRQLAVMVLQLIFKQRLDSVPDLLMSRKAAIGEE